MTVDRPVVRYAMVVEYDGASFHGSQLQAGLRTVQGELEQGLERLYGEAIRVKLASRGSGAPPSPRI